MHHTLFSFDNIGLLSDLARVGTGLGLGNSKGCAQNPCMGNGRYSILHTVSHTPLLVSHTRLLLFSCITLLSTAI